MLYLFISAAIATILSLFGVYNSIHNHSGWLGSGWIVSVIIAILCISATVFTGRSVQNTVHQNQIAKEEAKKSSKMPELTKNMTIDQLTSEDSDQQKAAKTDLKEQNALKSLARSFATIGKVSFNSSDKTYSVVPTTKDFAGPLRQIVKNPENASKANFDSIKESFVNSSKSIQKSVDSGYTLQLMNPDQTSKSLLSVKDGEIIYNYFK
ncbi:hypothetical protein [Pediococcus argentinicus]|uniref:Uncharacterized protein n=1 Tax=Pediococcus argentinicus TaxID=480391 RepID=A0A0R2NIK1_9LACO|nr:hypothetical protein [Pediococcus argentinicus]KRO25625.1 hypothetical protein IV88_GL001706 [Pediococcus argentinicus]NKZ22152.1 hypothetical protein [Pediococcus argentinicus]GEP19554.1 hypothetical protein LSA03_09380 [Pediococcus argentinicus]